MTNIHKDCENYNGKKDYCLECTVVCPSGALTYDKCFEQDSNECWNCESCRDCCLNDAITIRRQV